MCLSLESEFSCIVDAKQIQSIAAHDVREVNQSLLNVGHADASASTIGGIFCSTERIIHYLFLYGNPTMWICGEDIPAWATLVPLDSSVRKRR